MTSSRRSSAAGTSRPSTACAAPGTRRASASTWPGRSSALDGHAAVEGALAADEVLLDDDDLEAGVGQAARAHLPGRAGTDDHDVAAALAHGAQSIPVRPALQGRGILPRMLRPALALALVAAALARGLRIGLERARTADTTANATASTNDDTGGSSPGRRAARRPAAACAWSRSATSRRPLYLTAPPGDRRRLFVVEQAGRDRRRPRRQARGPAVPRHPLEGHGRRRAGPALDGLRARTTRSRGCSTSTTPRRAAPRRSGSTAAPATTAPTPTARGSCCAWTTPSPTTTAA